MRHQRMPGLPPPRPAPPCLQAMMVTFLLRVLIQGLVAFQAISWIKVRRWKGKKGVPTASYAPLSSLPLGVRSVLPPL